MKGKLVLSQIFVNSLELRWFYGVKSFSETSNGAVPGVRIKMDARNEYLNDSGRASSLL